MGRLAKKANLFVIILAVSFLIVYGVYFVTTDGITGFRSGNTAQTFLETMRHFPWVGFKAAAVVQQNFTAAQVYATNLSLELLPFLLQAPPTPVNQSCKPPPIDYLGVIHKCTQLSRPRKVGILMAFSYEVDILEIHLHELDAVVDKFFLIESIKPHLRFVTSKPLVWERLKRDTRFSPFAHKIVHFVIDDQDANQSEMSVNEDLFWDKFLNWNKAFQFFQDGDLLGFVDADEIPNRNNVAFMKYCQLPSDPINIGLWFPFGGLHTVFKSDIPVRGHPYTIAGPTFWTFGAAKNYKITTGKVPGKAVSPTTRHFLLGGLHLSRYLYLPHLMTKYLTCGECSWNSSAAITQLKSFKGFIDTGMLLAKGDLVTANKQLVNDLGKWRKRTLNLTEFKRQFPDEAENTVKVPWFLQCNMNRFPAIIGKVDPRLN